MDEGGFRTSTASWRCRARPVYILQADTETVTELIRHKVRIDVDTRLARFVIDRRKRPIPEMSIIGPIAI